MRKNKFISGSFDKPILIYSLGSLTFAANRTNLSPAPLHLEARWTPIDAPKS